MILCRIDRPREPRSARAPLYIVRPHEIFGAEPAFAETARFIKVSALIR
jgi:hypothetical protein